MLGCLDQLAWLQLADGKFPEAEAAFSEVLTIARRIYADTDPRLAWPLITVAWTLVRQGKAAEAETLVQQASALIRKIPAEQKLDIANDLGQLALIRRLQGRKAEAERLVLEQLPTLRQLGTPDQLAGALAELAGLLKEQGKLSEAEQAFRETLTIKRSVFEPSNLHLIKHLLYLAECLLAEGKLTAAESNIREAMAIQSKLPVDQRHPGESHWIGHSLEGLGYLDEAEKWYRQALADESSAPRLMPNEYAALIMSLVTAYFPRGRWHELEAAYPEWLQNARARLPPGDPALADVLLQVIYAPMAEGKYVEAENLARECLAIREKKIPNDWPTCEARRMLGSCLLNQKRYSEAEPFLLTGYECLTNHVAELPDGWRCDSLRYGLQWLVQLYEATDRSDLAVGWKKKIEEIK